MSAHCHVFTSESVTEGHPDKICDQISDAVLDAILEKETALAEAGYVAPNGLAADPKRARVACETLVSTGLVLVTGEIRTQAYIDVDKIVRAVVRDIGYVRAKYGFDAETCAVINAIKEQSPDIAQGVDNSANASSSDDPFDLIGAGDQGMVFGYACDETEYLMPLPIYLAHSLAHRLAQLRKDGTLDYLRPDGKTQVSIRYEGDRPVAVEKILVSAQHASEVHIGRIREEIARAVIAPVMDAQGIDWRAAEIYINPTGRFVIGGPMGDVGLTGRKIIVDTYGGMGRHGGGAFSGKDCTKTDRSAAYAARCVAKNIVAAKLAKRCEVQIAYAIGVAHPLSLMVDTFGTGVIDDECICDAVGEVFDLRPAAIIEALDLWRPIYRKTASYGHFGRPEFPWEQTNKTQSLCSACNL